MKWFYEMHGATMWNICHFVFFFSLNLIYIKNFRSFSISFHHFYPLRLAFHCLLQNLFLELAALDLFRCRCIMATLAGWGQLLGVTHSSSGNTEWLLYKCRTLILCLSCRCVNCNKDVFKYRQTQLIFCAFVAKYFDLIESSSGR